MLNVLLNPHRKVFDAKDCFRKFRYEWWIKDFQPKIPFQMNMGRFRIKVVEKSDELEAVLKLRHQVFYRELLGKDHWLGIDVDEFDLEADHIAIFDDQANELVGTFRLLSSWYSGSFYSATEFDMEEFLISPRAKLELGRVCVRKEHRNGPVLNLIWKGIQRYADFAKVDCIFGCSRIPIVNPYTVAAICRYFQEGQVVLPNNHSIRPREDHQLSNFETYLSEVNKMDGLSLLSMRKLIPPLLLGSFRVGAKVVEHPALDRKFSHVNFLTILEATSLKSLTA